MAEFLIRVHDKINPDSIYLDAQCTKRGDVIVACEDGHVWGKEELTNPDWRILQVPDLALIDAYAFTVPEPVRNPNVVSKTRQKRAFKLNLDAPILPKTLITYLADDKRKTPTILWPLTLPQLQAIKITKTAISDPSVTADPTIIG